MRSWLYSESFQPCCSNLKKSRGTGQMRGDGVVTGRSFPKDRFTVCEVAGSINGELIVSLLAGDVAACVFRDAVPQRNCRRLVSNFWENSGRRERLDGVPGHFIGAY